MRRMTAEPYPVFGSDHTQTRFCDLKQEVFVSYRDLHVNPFPASFACLLAGALPGFHRLWYKLCGLDVHFPRSQGSVQGDGLSAF